MSSVNTKNETYPLSTGSHAYILPNKDSLGQHILGYYVSERNSGQPILYFHGNPSCRIEADDFHKAGDKLNICIIGVDRPGIGLSTVRPGCTLLDWPRDIQKLALHLGFSEFRVFGGSGGGPYALACAREIPEAVLKGTGVLAGLGPPECNSMGIGWAKWLAFNFNRWTPSWMLSLFLDRFLGRHARDPDQTYWRKIVIDGMLKTMPAKDQTLLTDEETESWISSIRESCLAGSDGYVLDTKSVLRAWPFDLRDITAKVQIWNGTDDTDTPIASARWMVSRLPNGKLKEFPSDTHFSLFCRRKEEVLQDLIEM